MKGSELLVHPIDKENESLVIANAIKNSENREIFVRRVSYNIFRLKEYQTLAWGILEVARVGIEFNIEAILLKSKSCPVRYTVDYSFIKELINNIAEVPANNFIEHVEKLTVDSVKQSMIDYMTTTIFPACTNPTITLGELDQRFSYGKTIIERGYSSSKLGFKGLDVVSADFDLMKSMGISKRSTGFVQLDKYLTEGFKDGQITTVTALASHGKCMKKGTEIMMFDCSFKKIEDILSGDVLMGPDTKPRKVLSTTYGFGKMYRIVQRRGNDYYVNDKHILSLIQLLKKNKLDDAAIDGIDMFNCGQRYRIVNIPVEEAFNRNDYFFNRNKGYKAILDFDYREITEDPYIVGTSLRNDFDCFISKNYLYNSREVRLQMLAGILDEHGSVFSNFSHILIVSSSTFRDDIVFLSRSLGFYCTFKIVKKCADTFEKTTQLWKITIQGNNYTIPNRIQNKKVKFKGKKCATTETPIKIEYVGEDEYAGFELDGDGLYILRDFTVTHNSSLCLSMMKNLSQLEEPVPVAQFALEMNNTSLFTKLLSFRTRLPISTIIKKPEDLSEQERILYEWEKEQLARNKHIFLNDTPTQNIASVREQILLLQEHVKQKYIVVFIDLFGKLSDLQSSDNFARDYEKKLNQIQVMVRELGIHMVLVAQLNREVGKKNRRPTMNDLKNSHALTEVSDIILGLHRPYYDPEKTFKHNFMYGLTQERDEDYDDFDDHIETDPNQNISEVIILKQRMGPKDVLVNFVFDPVTTCFSPITESYQHQLNIRKMEEEDYE